MLVAVNVQKRFLQVITKNVINGKFDLNLQILKDKVDCMAGIEIVSAFNKSANLTTSRHTKEANSNSNCRTATSYLCHKHIKAYSCKTQHHQQRPLTLCLVVMMALTLALMPHSVNAAAMRKNLDTSAFETMSQTSVERELLLLESAEELIEEAIHDAIHSKLDSSSLSSAASSDSTDDALSSLDVLKHAQRMQEHQKESRKNLRKRHLNHLNNLRTFDGSSHQIEWHNPCNVVGVVSAQQNVDLANMPRRGYYYLKKFKEDIRKEYITRSLVLKHIRIDDIDSWGMHRDAYTFLPKLKQNSKISLSRWYRNMQMFVASFAYLGRTQYNWDKSKQHVSETTKELDQLLTSARLILCELETTINGSHPTKNVNMLKSLTRDEMADKLQFKTKEQDPNSEPHALDLKFTKNAYFKYLATMRKILKHKLNSKNRSVKIDSSENSSSENNTNAIDDTSVNISSAMRSDSEMSLGESFEMIMKSSSQQRPQSQRTHRRTRKNNANKHSAQLPTL